MKIADTPGYTSDASIGRRLPIWAVSYLGDAGNFPTLEDDVLTDFAYKLEITVNASPQAIFDIVSDSANHARLAGSEELKTIRQEPAGPVGLATHILAKETVTMADDTGMDLTADSIAVTFDVPNSFSWIVNPALPEQVRAGMDKTVANLESIAEGLA